MSNQTTTAPVEVQSMGKQAFVGLQMLFVAFGALVLVPLITGLNSNTALLTAGIGTLLFHNIFFLNISIAFSLKKSNWIPFKSHLFHNSDTN